MTKSDRTYNTVCDKVHKILFHLSRLKNYLYPNVVPILVKRDLAGDTDLTFRGLQGLRGKRMPYMNLKGLRGKRIYLIAFLTLEN
ncbi:hypothetical protein DICVIV_08258 [Dictyocaulus viviparus]|uniref:Uncharacterized protein n=1 Tax=Dictyocaulus viviparus TaxID=29172 RepID=A0A0D8XMF8_DICVI|nr:hypothetical protein DICVIV_08258 [Dictyocaulus viviparus]